MPVAPLNTYSLAGLQPAQYPELARTIALRVQPSLTNVPQGAIIAESTLNQDAVHTLAANGATGGTFTLTFRGFTTTVLNYNDTAATVATALNALPSVGSGGVVGSGTAVNGAGAVFTWSGAKFAKQPVELPVITIVTTFLTTQPAITMTTVGYAKGTGVLYVDGGANGIGTAKFINRHSFSSDSAGRITLATTASGEQFGQTTDKIVVYISGWFRCEDLLQTGSGAFDAAAAAELGRIVQGDATNGILRMN